MSLKKATIALNKLETQIENYAVSNPKISNGNVGWHIDHSLKVINNVVVAVQKSDTSTYKNDFKFLGKVFFKLGFFPRGKAKAPKSVKPPETILKEDIIVQMQQAKANIESIKSLDQNAYFKHPVFGNINTVRIPQFIAIHTNHHLKIINDILK